LVCLKKCLKWLRKPTKILNTTGFGPKFQLHLVALQSKCSQERLVLAVCRAYTFRRTRYFPSERVISSSQRALSTKHTTFMNSSIFNPLIPTIKRLKTCALDRTTTGISRLNFVPPEYRYLKLTTQALLWAKTFYSRR